MSHSFDGLLVESKSQAAQNMEAPRFSVFAHLDRKHHCSLIFGFACLFGKLGLHFVEQGWSAAIFLGAGAADPAAIIRTEARAVVIAHASMQTSADAAV